MMNDTASGARSVFAVIAIAVLAGCASPTPPWSPTVTDDPITGTKRCVAAAYDRASGGNFSRTGYLYPVVEFNSEFGLLVGVSSGGPVRLPVGNIVWRVDDKPYRELRALNNPTQGTPASASEAAADMTSARIAETIKYAQKLAANAGATATVASGEEAAAMLNEMLGGSALIYRANRSNAQFGLPTGQEQRVGQWTSDGMRPIPLDASFKQAVEYCREAIKPTSHR